MLPTPSGPSGFGNRVPGSVPNPRSGRFNGRVIRLPGSRPTTPPGTIASSGIAPDTVQLSSGQTPHPCARRSGELDSTLSHTPRIEPHRSTQSSKRPSEQSRFSSRSMRTVNYESRLFRIFPTLSNQSVGSMKFDVGFAKQARVQNRICKAAGVAKKRSCKTLKRRFRIRGRLKKSGESAARKGRHKSRIWIRCRRTAQPRNAGSRARRRSLPLPLIPDGSRADPSGKAPLR
jgi:hypothetical protein